MARDLKLQVMLTALDKVSGPMKRMMGGTKETAQQFKETRDRLKELQTQQGDVGSFRKLKTAQNETSKALKASQDRVRELAGEMSRSEKPTRDLTEAFRKAKGEAGKLKTKHSEQQIELHNLRTRLGEAGISTGKLSEAERKLRTDLATTNTSLKNREEALRRVSEQQRRMAKARTQLDNSKQFAGQLAGTGARGMALAGAGGFAASRLLAPGISYGQQMSELQAITRLEKDDERFKGLKQQARSLGATTAFSATEVGAGQTFLARAGFTPEAIGSSMQDILNLALANNTDLAKTADIASNISSAFKIDPEVEGNITRVADVLSGTASRANVDLSMLGDTMKYLGGASDLDLSLEQAAAMSGLLGNIGIQGSQAGTTLRAMMNRLTGPAKNARKAMEALGIEVADGNGNMLPMTQILQSLNDATSDMGNVARKAYLTDIFGAEAGSGMAELVSNMADGKLDDLIGQLAALDGENARMAVTLNDNAGGDLKGLRSAWEEVGIGITEANDGPLREMIQSLTEVVRGVGTWIQNNPEMVSALAKMAGGIALIVGVGGTLLVTLASIIGPIAMVKYGFVMAAIAVNAMTWPILAVIAAVAALAVAAFLIYKHWDKIASFFSGMWNEVTSAFDLGIFGIGKLLLSWSPLGILYRGFTAALGALGIEIPEQFKTLGGAIIDGLLGGLFGGMGKLKDGLFKVGGNARDWLAEKLGIRSPSRVFAALGDDTMAGLRQGLERSENGPIGAVLRTGKALIGAGAMAVGVGTASPAMAIDSRPPMGAQIQQAAQAPVTYHFEMHIHTQSGSDTQDIARAVRAEMERAGRQLESKRRSALYDNE